MVRNRLRGWMPLGAALALAPAAHALSITGYAITANAGNTAASSSTNSNNNTEVNFALSTISAPGGPIADTVGSGTISFQSNYDWLVTADRDNNGPGGP